MSIDRSTLPGLAIVMVAVLGPRLFNTVLAVTVSSLPGYVRLAMVAGARDFIGRTHWVGLAPGGAILAAVLCVTVVGDAMRDALDPRRGEPV